MVQFKIEHIGTLWNAHRAGETGIGYHRTDKDGKRLRMDWTNE